MKRDLPVEHIRRAFRYDPETGVILRAPHWKKVSVRADGAKSGASVKIGTMRISARRLVWALVTGTWPPAHPGYIRTRNGDPLDLRWANLYSRDDESHCARCDTFKPVSEFHSRGVTKTGLPLYVAYCKPCTALRHQERPDWAHRNKVKKYGLTEQCYADMLAEQGGVCAICKDPPGVRRLAIDHCHSTGVVRGLLCGPCNVSLGQFKDNPRILLEAAKYLIKRRS
jgi:hypothetical protein